jgi:hypothetical protein
LPNCVGPLHVVGNFGSEANLLPASRDCNDAAERSFPQVVLKQRCGQSTSHPLRPK